MIESTPKDVLAPHLSPEHQRGPAAGALFLFWIIAQFFPEWKTNKRRDHMISAWYLIPAVLVGALFGMFLACLMAANRDGKE